MTDKWEVVVAQGHHSMDRTDRLRVPDGWLYRTLVEYAVQAKHFPDHGLAISMIFVPDPEVRP